jgi:hypothetical protein
MEKEFVNYEQSVALKELGFDEPCIKYYWTDGMFSKGYENPFNYNKRDNVISAPTFSQAFRWFREKYKLHQNIEQYYGEKFYFNIKDMVHPRRWDEYPVKKLKEFNESDSQEEAELECLKRLIDLVKNSK